MAIPAAATAPTTSSNAPSATRVPFAETAASGSAEPSTGVRNATLEITSATVATMNSTPAATAAFRFESI